MRKLTIVQMLPALESGGVEKGTLEVGKYLVESGHRSIVISKGGRLVPQLEREGSEHLNWDVGRKSPLTLLRYIWRLRRFLHEQQVDVLHLRSRLPAWVGYLAWRGMPANRRTHLVTTVHGLYSVGRYSSVMVKGEKVIAVSNTVRDYILKGYPDVQDERIEVIFRGVDPKVFYMGFQPTDHWLQAWRKQYPQLLGKQVLLLPGRITRLKGHEDFIQLIGLLIKQGLPIHGLIVGGAQANKQAYLQELHELVSTAGLQDDITFTGQRGDLREIMAVSNLVLSLSTQPESFGRTVLEAMSLGIPVVGYDHGGVGEQLRTLLPEGCITLRDIESLRIRVSEWLASPPEIPDRHDFTLDNLLERTLKVYQQLAEQA